jgi:hypothetical protein
MKTRWILFAILSLLCLGGLSSAQDNKKELIGRISADHNGVIAVMDAAGIDRSWTAQVMVDSDIKTTDKLRKLAPEFAIYKDSSMTSQKAPAEIAAKSAAILKEDLAHRANAKSPEITLTQEAASKMNVLFKETATKNEVLTKENADLKANIAKLEAAQKETKAPAEIASYKEKLDTLQLNYNHVAGEVIDLKKMLASAEKKAQSSFVGTMFSGAGFTMGILFLIVGIGMGIKLIRWQFDHRLEVILTSHDGVRGDEHRFTLSTMEVDSHEQVWLYKCRHCTEKRIKLQNLISHLGKHDYHGIKPKSIIDRFILRGRREGQEGYKNAA